MWAILNGCDKKKVIRDFMETYWMGFEINFPFPHNVLKFIKEQDEDDSSMKNGEGTTYYVRASSF